jgi:hypothetical protein
VTARTNNGNLVTDVAIFGMESLRKNCFNSDVDPNDQLVEGGSRKKQKIDAQPRFELGVCSAFS